MPSSTISRGNLLNEVLIAVTLTPSSVAALSSGTQTFALPGSLTTDFIETFPAAAGTANMLIQNCWVSSAGIVAIQWLNTSAVAITPATGTYNVNLLRPENIPLPANMI